MKSAAILFCLFHRPVKSRRAGRHRRPPASHIHLSIKRFFRSGYSTDATSIPPENTWNITNGLIHCTGRPNGFMRTEKNYRDYAAPSSGAS